MFFFYVFSNCIWFISRGVDGYDSNRDCELVNLSILVRKRC